jgi:hypothetical protein
MKKWYEELDEATKQRIKTYSAFNDWESKDLMLQTLHEAEQKEIEEFKETNHELAELAIARNKRITKAKELIENIIRVTWGEGWNYSLDWKAKAEQFLKEIKENDRQRNRIRSIQTDEHIHT